MENKDNRPLIREVPKIKIGDYEFYCGMDLMEVMQCSERTIRRYLESGKLKGMKFAGKWYVSADSFDRFIENQMSETSSKPKSPKKKSK